MTAEQLEIKRRDATIYANRYARTFVGLEMARNYANYYSAIIADEDDAAQWPTQLAAYSKWRVNNPSLPGERVYYGLTEAEQRAKAIEAARLIANHPHITGGRLCELLDIEMGAWCGISTCRLDYTQSRIPVLADSLGRCVDYLGNVYEQRTDRTPIAST
jgi:hypothetical protein